MCENARSIHLHDPCHSSRSKLANFRWGEVVNFRYNSTVVFQYIHNAACQKLEWYVWIFKLCTKQCCSLFLDMVYMYQANMKD